MDRYAAKPEGTGKPSAAGSTPLSRPSSQAHRISCPCWPDRRTTPLSASRLRRFKGLHGYTGTATGRGLGPEAVSRETERAVACRSMTPTPSLRSALRPQGRKEASRQARRPRPRTQGQLHAEHAGGHCQDVAVAGARVVAAGRRGQEAPTQWQFYGVRDGENRAAQAIPSPRHIPWFETGERANKAYLKARQDAIRHGGLRNKFLQRFGLPTGIPKFHGMHTHTGS